MDTCHKKGCPHHPSYNTTVVAVVGVTHLCSRHIRDFGRCAEVIAAIDVAMAAEVVLDAAVHGGDVAAVRNAFPEVLATRAALRAAVFAWLDTPDAERTP